MSDIDLFRKAIKDSLLACSLKMQNFEFDKKNIELRIVSLDTEKCKKFERQDIVNIYKLKNIKEIKEIQQVSELMHSKGLYMTVQSTDLNHILAQYVLHLQNVLFYAWDYDSIKCFASTGCWVPWSIPDYLMDECINLLVSLMVYKTIKRKFVIPLIGVEVEEGCNFEIDLGVFIKPWSVEEKSYYMHRWSCHDASNGFGGILNSTSYIEIFIDENSGNPASSDVVEDVMCRVKWAITRLHDYKGYIKELFATNLCWLSCMYSVPYCRDNTNYSPSSENTYIDFNNSKLLSNNIKKLNFARKNFPEINNSLWFLDRAMMAKYSRDALFEAVIGMERILVLNSGDNARRFKTYGTALLHNNDSKDVNLLLNKLYNLRSQAAHGADESKSDYRKFCKESVKLLSDLISVVVYLVDNNKLMKIKNKDSLSGVIEVYLLNMLYESALKDRVDH